MINRFINNDENNNSAQLFIEPIIFETIEQIAEFRNQLEPILGVDNFRKHFLVAQNGFTYLLDDILSGKIKEEDKQTMFLCRDIDGKIQELSLEEIQQKSLSEIQRMVFIYNNALAKAFQSSKIKERKTDYIDFLILDEASYHCGLQKCEMPFPSITPDGHSYCSTALENWLADHTDDPAGVGELTSRIINPKTRQRKKDFPLTMENVLPNHSLQSLNWVYWDYKVKVKINQLGEARDRIKEILNNQPMNPKQKNKIALYENTITNIKADLQRIKENIDNAIILNDKKIQKLSDIIDNNSTPVTDEYKAKLKQERSELISSMQRTVIKTVAAIIGVGLPLSYFGLRTLMNLLLPSSPYLFFGSLMTLAASSTIPGLLIGHRLGRLFLERRDQIRSIGLELISARSESEVIQMIDNKDLLEFQNETMHDFYDAINCLECASEGNSLLIANNNENSNKNDDVLSTKILVQINSSVTDYFLFKRKKENQNTLNKPELQVIIDNQSNLNLDKKSF